MAATGLKLRADLSKTRLPWRSPLRARTSPKSATIACSRTTVRVDPIHSTSRVSFGGDASATVPSAAYRQGRPPSAICVPAPVGVKNAGIPEPPARSRSARVPWGVSSTSSSPVRY